MTDIDYTEAGRRDDDPLEVKPTLFIGLGGTGMEVLLRVRRRILQQPWGPNRKRLASMSEFPAAAFLYFDTDTNEARETDRAKATDPMSAAVAFEKGETLQKKVDVAFYQKELTTKPHIGEWMPSSDLSRIDTEKGAGQVRAISRLLFFDVYQAFHNLVQAKGQAVLQNITNQRMLSELGIKTQQELRIVVVASTAGGTGSGSFIDVGFACSSMDVNGRKPQTDLFLMLPGGYVGANRERVFANTYAALSELEHVMRPAHKPPYVTRWTETARTIADKPYRDVYLVDTANLVGQSTSDVADVFDMMADALTEDFASSEFARRKRQVAVNQDQHKATMFYPDPPGGLGRSALAYARGFSSMGQTVVATTGSLEYEAGLARTGVGLMEAFFGITAERKSKPPTPDERDTFMAEHMSLGVSYFGDFSKWLKERPAAIAEYRLLDALTVRPTGESISGTVREWIEKEANTLRGGAEPKSWEREIRGMREQITREVDGVAGQDSTSSYGPRGAEIAQVRAALARAWRSPTGERSLPSLFYNLLDDQEKAGLNYTVKLIEMIKDQLDAPGHGVVAQLRKAEDEYNRLADLILRTSFEESVSRVAQAARPQLFGDRGRMAETYLGQATDDLKDYALYRLRAIAAREAQVLLTEISAFFGQRLQGLDDKGETRWSGLIAEFLQGFQSVRAALDMIREDAARIEDAKNRPETGMFLVVKGAGVGEMRVDPDQRLEWAREAFRGFGGCRAMFQKLRSADGQMEILNQLRAITSTKLAHYESRIPPILDALRDLKRTDPAQARDLMRRMLERAMPWFQASSQTHFKPKAEQFKAFIAVDQAREFREEFAADIRALLPAGFGIDPGYTDSGVPGRIVCYIELSGIPLDYLVQLRGDWREAYQRQLSAPDAYPLHNHRDILRFPDPIAMDTAAVEALKATLSLFLRGLAFGFLRRDRVDPANPGQASAYLLDMGGGDIQSVGSERTLRRRGFAPHHRARLERALADYEGGLGPVQALAASALFQYLANRAYAKRRALEQDQEQEPIAGVAHQVAQALAAEFLRRYETSDEASRPVGEPETARETLYNRLPEWTTLIAGSLQDVDPLEANLSTTDSDQQRAQDKRQVDRRAFTEANLTAILEGGAAPSPADRRGGPPPPPRPGGPFWADAPGLQNRELSLTELQDLARQGRITGSTLVYDGGNGSAGWMRMSALPGVASLLNGPPPAPPTAQFWLAADGRTTGPFTVDDLRAQASSGALTGRSQVQRTLAGSTWIEAASAAELAGLFAPVAPEPPPPPPQPAAVA